MRYGGAPDKTPAHLTSASSRIYNRTAEIRDAYSHKEGTFMKIADIHVHIFPHKLAEKASASIGSFYGTHTAHLASVETLLPLEQAAGIDCCAVSSSATSPHQVQHINDFIAAEVRVHPNLIGLGTLFPAMEGWEAELERIAALGLKGLKIHPDFQHTPIDLPEAIPMYRAVAKAGLPVLFHMGDAHLDYSSPQRLTNLIRQVPDLVAIAAHFGGWQCWEKSYAHVQPENVYYDTSSSLRFLGRDRALEYLDRLGAHRFLYGTDFPMWTPAEELQRFRDLGLPPDLENQILFQNFAKLFGI